MFTQTLLPTVLASWTAYSQATPLLWTGSLGLDRWLQVETRLFCVLVNSIRRRVSGLSALRKLMYFVENTGGFSGSWPGCTTFRFFTCPLVRVNLSPRTTVPAGTSMT